MLSASMTPLLHPTSRATPMQDFASAWFPSVLYAAVELDLAECITDEPTAYEQIARAAQAQPALIFRLLRTLAANGVFVHVDGGKFAHNEASRQLCKDHPMGVRPMVRLFGSSRMQHAWEHLAAAVRSGKSPYALANGEDLYAFLGHHPEDAKVFNEAMIALTHQQLRSLLGAYPALTQAKRILDVGGGMGQLLVGLLQVNSGATGAVLDLPQLSAPCEENLTQQQLTTRATFISGSFLEPWPQGFDFYIIKNALLNWPDDAVVQILTHAAHALTGDAKLLIAEPVIDSANQAWTTLMDLMMLVAPSGRCRTRPEYEALTARAGLRISHASDAGDTSIMECVTVRPTVH